MMKILLLFILSLSATQGTGATSTVSLQPGTSIPIATSTGVVTVTCEGSAVPACQEGAVSTSEQNGDDNFSIDRGNTWTSPEQPVSGEDFTLSFRPLSHNFSNLTVDVNPPGELEAQSSQSFHQSGKLILSPLLSFSYKVRPSHCQGRVRIPMTIRYSSWDGMTQHVTTSYVDVWIKNAGT